MQTVTFDKYLLEHAFGKITEAQAREVADFWYQHRAIGDPQEARRRTKDVCWIARSASNEIVAVCTLYTEGFGKPPLPHYFYRMFVRPQDRKSGLAIEMVRLTRKSLAADYRPGQLQQGLIIVTENPVLMHPAARELFVRWRWVHQGKTYNGEDIWRLGYEQMNPDPQ